MIIKKFALIGAVALSMAALSSCTGKEELPRDVIEEEGYKPDVEYVRMSFTARMDGEGAPGQAGETRTSLQDGTDVVWNSDDAISVIARSTRTNSTFSDIQLSGDGKTATFSGETAPSDSYFAIYPAQSAQLATDFKTVTMDLPWSQTAVAGSFATGTNVALATSTDTDELYFRNVGSLLYFTIASTSRTVKAVRLTAEGSDGRSLTGRAAVELDDAGVPFISDMLSNCGCVQLNGEFTVGSRYYFVVYPGEYDSISISFISSDDKIATFSTTSSLTANRNRIKLVGNFNIPDSKWEESTGSSVYTRLDSASLPSDYSGDYLIVYEDGDIAFDGSRSTLDATGNGFEVTIKDGTIPVTEESREKEFTVAAIEGGYSICSASGLYIGQTSDANGLKSGSNAYVNSISGTGDIISGKAHLRYNANSGQTRFRYYKSDTYTSQKAVVLYKRGSGSGITDPEQTEARPKLFVEESIYVDAAGESGTTPITLVDADEWNVSVSCSGCVTGATLSDDRSTISYIVRKNTTTSPDSGTIIVTLSKTGFSDIITSIEVNQEAGEEEEEASWVLVTDASSLKAGDVIVLASNGNQAVAGALSSSYLESVRATFSTDDLKTITELPATAVIFTLMGESGSWKFSSASGLLGTTAAKTLCWGSETTTWTISIDSSTGRATVTSTETAYGSLQYNKNSPRFTTYTSSQVAVQLYRSTNGHDDPPLQTPYATTLNDITGRTTGGATVSGNFFSGDAAPTAAFFKYGASEGNLNLTEYAATPTTTSGTFSAEITGLAENSWCWYQACITVGGTTYKGEVCSFKTASTSPSGEGGACRGWFELPAQKDDNHDGIDDGNSDFYYSWTMRADATTVRNFSSCYSKSMIHPVWVAAPMHSCYLGSSGRNESYKNDPNIHCTQNSKFDGYTRGHMVGSSDRTVSVATNRQAFYYSNIGAQTNSGFNTGGGAWNNLEGFTDSQMCSDTLYQVIGCIFETFTDKYGSTVSKKTASGANGTFQVPTAWYKVLLRTKNGASGKSVDQCSASELKCAAFILAHRSNAGHKPTSKDMYTVAEVEELTGLTFFVNVPNAPKSTAVASDWGL